MKVSIKYIVITLAVSNLLYELYRKKYNAPSNLSIDDKQVLSKSKRLLNKFKESFKFRATASAVIVFISCVTTYNRPQVSNLGHRQNPLSLTLPYKEIPEDEFVRFMNFVSSDPNQKSRRKIGETIIDNDLDRNIKIVILKYRFHDIINIQGRKENSLFLALAIQTILSGTVPGYYGLRCIQEALKKLWEEGKLSTELLKLLMNMFESVQMTPAQFDAIMDLLKKTEESTSAKVGQLKLPDE